MKRKIVVLLLAGCMLTACGTAGTTTEQAVTTNIANHSAEQVAQEAIEAKTPVDFDGSIGNADVSSIQIPDYKDIKVEVPTYSLSQDEINQQINNEYANLIYQTDRFTYTDTDKDTVENGDIVLLDYTGKLDEEVFDGGSATDAHLEIGSGSFVDGFESGMEGMKVGETKDISVTFPEDYQNADLAGKSATFTVTVKKIQTRDIPEMTDDSIKALGIGVETVTDFTGSITQNLTNQLLTKNMQAKNTAIEQALAEAIDVTVPDDTTNALVDKMLSTYQAEADEHGESLEEYFDEHMGTPLSQYREDCFATAKDMVKKNMIFQAIADKEGVFVSEEALQRQAEADYQSMGYESVDEYMEKVDKQSLYDFILENAVIGKIEDQLSITKLESVSLLQSY